MNFVRAIDDAQDTRRNIAAGQMKILGDAGAAVDLYGPVDYPSRHPRGHHLDHRDFLARQFIADGVHQVRGLVSKQSRLIDLHAGLGDGIHDHALFDQRLTKGDTLAGAFAHRFEGAFRLAGYGHPTSFFVASPHHEKGALIENTKFAWRFLPPTLARASQPTLLRREKSPGTTRVFMFGESAAEGDPEPAFGMPRLLEVLLEGRFPGRDFEVINAAVTAINSHAILPIARECAGLDGDFWVLYIGHNEVMGPFGAGTIFGQKTPPLATLRLGLSLKQLRLGQWIASFLVYYCPSYFPCLTSCQHGRKKCHYYEYLN